MSLTFLDLQAAAETGFGRQQFELTTMPGKTIFIRVLPASIRDKWSLEAREVVDNGAKTRNPHASAKLAMYAWVDADGKQIVEEKDFTKFLTMPSTIIEEIADFAAKVNFPKHLEQMEKQSE